MNTGANVLLIFFFFYSVDTELQGNSPVITRNFSHVTPMRKMRMSTVLCANNAFWTKEWWRNTILVYWIEEKAYAHYFIHELYCYGGVTQSPKTLRGTCFKLLLQAHGNNANEGVTYYILNTSSGIRYTLFWRRVFSPNK